MQIEKRKLVQAFRKKGFERRNSHHAYFVYIIHGKKKRKIKTYISHGAKPKNLDDYLIKRTAEQMYLTKEQFLEFVECTIDQEEYEKIVSKKLGDDE